MTRSCRLHCLVISELQLEDRSSSYVSFTNTNTRRSDIFERFDRYRSGRIDSNELREALCSLGFAVSPSFWICWCCLTVKVFFTGAYLSPTIDTTIKLCIHILVSYISVT
ncbi:hypothetical protein GH714_034812 [Hevea brasiliensis]|uniref:EF-hand domain-containing protein n=1 Tax=Hevea brasiliensis TaxID=3981 RepID=A0A6A6M800_HEVBR|nr:hypothetical protein GH714_034812 [Hevea brasiliensis]